MYPLPLAVNTTRAKTMNKEAEYSRGRNDGLALALRIVREGGPAELERECRMRGAMGVNTSLARKELDKATEKIKLQIIDAMLIMCVAVLQDEFGFGTKRLQRFKEKFDEGTGYLIEGYAEWEDYIDSIKDQLGLELGIRYNGGENANS